MSKTYHRDLLKYDQTKAFCTWLSANGILHREGKGEFQLLQVKTAPDCWATINRNAQNVLSTHPDLKPLINAFKMKEAAKNRPNPKGEEAFKNFHRSLCERFGATHDPVDWWRDTVSLEECIASQVAKPAPEPTNQFLDDLRDDFAMAALKGLLANPHFLQPHPDTGRSIGPKTPELALRDAYRFADAALEARKVKS